MNLKRYILALLALFVFIFLYEFLVHGNLLIGMYQETPTLWRDFTDFDPNIFILQFLLAAWTTLAFTQFFKEGGIKNGLLFGLYIGIFAALLTASWYFWLPVSAKLGWSWFVTSAIEGILGGLIIGSIYHTEPESNR